MKVFSNIEKLNISIDDKSKLKKVVNELVPLRKNRKATYDYIETHLEIDERLNDYNYWCMSVDLNKGNIINPYGDSFKQNEGEIKYKKIGEFRNNLLTVIEDDKISFGYIYYFLTSAENRKAKSTIYHNVFTHEEILYAIDYDIDELRKDAEGIEDLKKRFLYLEKRKNSSDSSNYNGPLKDRFNEVYSTLSSSIKTEHEIFGDNNPTEKTSSECSINEEKLKKYFKLSFKGGGNGNMDHFQNLVDDLKISRSDKDMARIALMIYESEKLLDSMKPRTFAAWYKKFCELVGCEFHESYNKSKLNLSDEFQRGFGYLVC